MKKFLYLFVVSGLLAPSLLNSMSREAIVLGHLDGQSILKPLMLKKDPKTLPLYNCFLKEIYEPSQQEYEKIDQKWNDEQIEDSEVLILARRFQYQLLEVSMVKEINSIGEDLQLFKHFLWLPQYLCDKIMKDSYDSETIAQEAVLIVGAIHSMRDDKSKPVIIKMLNEFEVSEEVTLQEEEVCEEEESSEKNIDDDLENEEKTPEAEVVNNLVIEEKAAEENQEN